MQTRRTHRQFWLEATALLAAALVAVTLAEPAFGQGTLPCSPSLQSNMPGTTTTGEGPARPAPAPDNLTGKLAQSGGVICPPAAVDPEMKLPTPEAGNTPVIPPPGTPGGDSNVQPK